MWVGIIQLFKGLNGTKGKGKANSHSVFWSRDAHLFLTSDIRAGSQDFCFKVKVIPLAPLVLRPWDSGLIDCATGFPGSPAYRWKTGGLLVLYNRINQF